MAQATHTLRFGTSVYIGPLRDIVSLAKAVGTCAALAPDRIMCGLGAGWMREEFDVVGQDFETRGKRMDEMIAVLPRLWSGETTAYEGDHIMLPALRMRPPAGNVPILIGGNTKPALRRAAAADGWIAAFTGMDALASMLGEFVTERDRQGRTGAASEVLVTATPGIFKHADQLSALGVDAVVVPGVALGHDSTTDALLEGMERYAARL